MRTRPFFIVVVLIVLSAALMQIHCAGSKSITSMTVRELFAEGKNAYDKGKYLRAIEALQSCVYNYPGETIVDTAQYYLALAYFGNEEFEVAQVEFNRLVLNYPASVYFENAIFMKAVCSYEGTPKHSGLDQVELEKAIKQLEDFIVDFPESETTPDAHKYLQAARARLARKYFDNGIVYSNMGAYSSAQIYFQKVIDEYTDTDFASQATYEYANMEFMQKEYDKARTSFNNFCTVFPEHDLNTKAREMAMKAAFKSGEAAFERGQYGIANRKFESFMIDFPDSKLVKKAEKYLNKIAELPIDSLQVENAGS